MIEYRVKQIDLISGLSRALDLISPLVTDHHNRVGYISSRLAHMVGMSAEHQRDALLAGLMHDAGVFSMSNRLDTIRFEADGYTHAKVGYKLLRTVPDLENISRWVLHHHDKYRDLIKCDCDYALEGNLIFLADRIDVLMRKEPDPSRQREMLLRTLKKLSGSLFNPEYFQAFEALSDVPEFWNGVYNPTQHLNTLADECLECRALNLDELAQYGQLFSQIIDFKSRFTATHSRGVADTAIELGARLGLDVQHQKLAHIAGLFHDLGKLGIPRELLEQKEELSKADFERIKSHALHGYDILASIPGLSELTTWSMLHHERMDGKGYPFGLKQEGLPLGARIVAVADVFTAITEDRPYRAGMSDRQARAVLDSMVPHSLDKEIVGELLSAYDDLNDIRVQGQRKALDQYTAFYTADAVNQPCGAGCLAV